jgi:hypothetical protein
MLRLLPGQFPVGVRYVNDLTTRREGRIIVWCNAVPVTSSGQ